MIYKNGEIGKLLVGIGVDCVRIESICRKLSLSFLYVASLTTVVYLLLSATNFAHFPHSLSFECISSGAVEQLYRHRSRSQKKPTPKRMSQPSRGAHISKPSSTLPYGGWMDGNNLWQKCHTEVVNHECHRAIRCCCT